MLEKVTESHTNNIFVTKTRIISLLTKNCGSEKYAIFGQLKCLTQKCRMYSFSYEAVLMSTTVVLLNNVLNLCNNSND